MCAARVRRLNADDDTEEAMPDNQASAPSKQQSTKSSRKERSDKGSIVLNERDTWALKWIGEQYGVPIQQLQELLGRRPRSREGQKTKEPNKLTKQRVINIVQRWKKAGLVATRRLVLEKQAASGTWVYLTKLGLKEVGLSFPEWTPKSGTLLHKYRVNEARLYVEGVNERVQVRSERYLHKLNPDAAHYPDLDFVARNYQTAVEVELTQKNDSDFRLIVQWLAENYDLVWYFVGENHKKEVVQLKIASIIGEEKARRFFARDF